MISGWMPFLDRLPTSGGEDLGLRHLLGAGLEDKLPDLTCKASKLLQVPHRKMVGNNFALVGKAVVLPAAGSPPGPAAKPATGKTPTPCRLRAHGGARGGRRHRSRHHRVEPRYAGDPGRDERRVGARRPRRQASRLRGGEGARPAAVSPPAALLGGSLHLIRARSGCQKPRVNHSEAWALPAWGDRNFR